jgi:hypothetical protein
MIKMIMMLALLISCGKQHHQLQTVSSAQTDTELQAEEMTQKDLGAQFKTRIKMVNFSPKNKKKVHKAAGLIQRVVMSQDFKEAILDARFTDTMGLSNLEIYEKIMRGSEKLSPKEDYEMDVVLETFYADAVTVGYTMTGSQKVFMNRKFLHRFTPAEVTSNIMHEWLHKLGFSHEVEDSPARRDSVPYSVGYIVRNLARKLK